MSKHEQQAKYWLNDASAEYRNGNAKRADLCVGRAQVEATLALAEQQRIANLIALATVPTNNLLAGRPALDARKALVEYRADGEYEGVGIGYDLLRPEIAQALGVES